MKTKPSKATGVSVADVADKSLAMVDNIAKVIEGKDEVIRLAIVCLLSGGHLLIEDVPGVGKTMLAKALARSSSCIWRRIQFTPDLLASDVTGVSIFDNKTGQFQFRHGAVFANLVLGDEINRASPKTQSALLEAMEERQVTVDGVTYPLHDPFMVMATQNPLEHEGIYPLPHSQIDRFTMRINIGYPTRETEIEILDVHGADTPLDRLDPVVTTDDLVEMVRGSREVFASDEVKRYIVDVVEATRVHPLVLLGASPRAALFLLRTSRARAAMQGREFVLPDDVKAQAGTVLSHRIILSSDAEIRGAKPEQIVNDVLTKISVP